MTDDMSKLGLDAPLNDLERDLFAVMQGQMKNEEFLQIFVNAQVYIMVDGEPEGDHLGDRKPMVVASAPDAPKLLAVFSDPRRADKLKSMFQEYDFPILVDSMWALEALGPHMGLAFNPGCHFGFEMAPEGAQQLKAAIRPNPDAR